MKLRTTAFLLLTALANPSHSAFYVDEEAHQPTTARLSQAYDIPFYIKRSQLGPMGRQSLQILLNDAKQASRISITGYSDTRHSAALGRKRGNTIREWLVQHGIASEKITVDESYEANPADLINISNSTVSILRTQSATAFSLGHEHSATLVKPEKITAATQMNHLTPVINDPVKLAIVNKLIALGQSKIIKPEDAMVLLAELLKNHDATPYSPAPIANNAQVAATEHLPTIQQLIPLPELSRTWILSSDKTLQENIAEWAHIAGWEKPVWEAGNPYQVTFSSTMKGTFLEVLGQLSKAVPALDIHVWKNKRVFRVADRG